MRDGNGNVLVPLPAIVHAAVDPETGKIKGSTVTVIDGPESSDFDDGGDEALAAWDKARPDLAQDRPFIWTEPEPRREGRIPPRRYLRKVLARIGRLEELGLHEVIRPDTGLRFPDKMTRRQYMEVHDKLFGEDLPGIFEALLGEDAEDLDAN